MSDQVSEDRAASAFQGTQKASNPTVIDAQFLVWL
jgi:hypothetical protein